MKKTLIFIFVVVLSVHSAFSQTDEKRSTPKIGLVLSGGGAKGFAHIGALKVIEEAGIPIDYIAGTSIGSIIGGLYAMGYRAEELEKLIKSQDWRKLLSDNIDRRHMSVLEKKYEDRYLLKLPIHSKRILLPAGIVEGHNLIDLFSYLSLDFHNVSDFSELPIPFLCVATDLETGEEVVQKQGFLPLAIRSSMAIPAIFSAVEINNKLLVDGGIVNNFPVDRCLEMGADIIIGVNIHPTLNSKENLHDISDVMGQLINMVILNERYLKNIANTDVYICPNITDFSAASFNSQAADTLIERGVMAAKEVLPQLIHLRDSLGLKPNKIKHIGFPKYDRMIKIDNITASGVDHKKIPFFYGKMGIKKGDSISLGDFRKGISKIYGSMGFNNVEYHLNREEENTLELKLNRHKSVSVNFGLHYNTDENAALLINATIRGKSNPGSMLSFDGILTDQPAASVRYILNNGWKPGLFLEGNFRNEGAKIPSYGSFIGNKSIQELNLQVATHSILFNAFRVTAGAEVNKVYTESSIGLEEDLIGLDSEETFFNYILKINIDNLNSPVYPIQGWKMDVAATIGTDDGLTYKKELPFGILSFSLLKPVIISPSFTLVPHFYGRLALGSNVPDFYQTHFGGFYPFGAHHNSIPFIGLRRMEYSASNVVAFRMDLRYNVSKNIYASLIPNIGIYSLNSYSIQDPNSLDNVIADSVIFGGGGIMASYDSYIGPIEIIISTSSLRKKLTSYVSVGYYF